MPDLSVLTMHSSEQKHDAEKETESLKMGYESGMSSQRGGTTPSCTPEAGSGIPEELWELKAIPWRDQRRNTAGTRQRAESLMAEKKVIKATHMFPSLSIMAEVLVHKNMFLCMSVEMQSNEMDTPETSLMPGVKIRLD
ncbi:hypothetical protein EYF80_032112 [Liparis tanakae]|uniref:Uncharacterized protein n=1 Tax=Liparis tanakae TaxID=230148 RepID=A0A4Z2GWL7_9TELE|nr:hypothetical protein EYF80_032112 [Liparis tanakae]